MSRPPAASGGSAFEVFRVFLRLGLVSFGGPIAHLGYFHREFVVRRGWLDETRYAQLLAPCQFLPGPASSQFGFSIGLLRAGWGGGVAAFIGFTLPSALLLLAFARYGTTLGGTYGHAVLHGLKLVAVAVVAQGVLTMARKLAPDWPRRAIAVGAAAAVLWLPMVASQLPVIAAGAVLGICACHSASPAAAAPLPLSYGARTGAVLLGVFGLLLAASLMVPQSAPLLLRAASALFRVGALVFGGGHVVLPLLQQALLAPGWLGEDEFLAGYGAAQAVPGPMFSVAAFLGARLMGGEGGAAGALVCLLSLFLPGLLLIAWLLPYWSRLAANARAVRAMAGINAAVVGLLAAALYDPLWTGAVHGAADAGIALIGLLLLAGLDAPALAVVGWCIAASLGLAVLA